ncbi:hypothetical protein [Xanthobacter tagetidis]|uniref:Uncharacterized protein n=1 Tax=Xanthobacter tagetidis TaxID=60216 RepID=A0A3L7AJC7_9HYPH|nr:hypothetical protein [Xanthobacter tagetidis]MBB6306277.1 hypothetical protein [Xanthobacter tagetidis]RLP79552.1 hypothetical protein D9R14_07770 [Xanthobacter tagetidis]
MNETIRNAIIEAATLYIERGFILTSFVHLNYGGSGQGYGGYVLGGLPDSKAGAHAEQGNLAAEWITGIMRAAGVEDWKDLPGKSVRVRLSQPGLGGMVEAIGHIIRDDRWFDSKEAFARLASPSRGREGGPHD